MINLLIVDHVTKILGGAEVNLLQLLTQLDQRRFNPVVACVAQGVLAEQLQLQGVDCEYFTLDEVVAEYRLVNKKFSWQRAIKSLGVLGQAARQLQEIATRRHSNLLLSITNKDHFLAGIAARRLGIPSLWWVNDIINAQLFNWPVRWGFALMAQRYAEHLVTVSEQGRQALINLTLSPTRIETIYNGINPEYYRRRPVPELRTAWNVPANGTVVTILGRVTPWKGQDIFIAMAERLMSQFPNAYFRIVGGVFNEDQAYVQALRERIDGLNCGNQLQIMDFHEDVTAVYSASDILVHCSRNPEAFGRVLIEGMSCELPVVAAADGGVKEVVTDGNTGYLVSPGDVTGYVTAVGNLLAQPEQAQAMGRRGRQRVLQEFTLQRTVRCFEERIVQLVDLANSTNIKSYN
jgi:glycosyltransferase involved in cell wall biosynthesis